MENVGRNDIETPPGDGASPGDTEQIFYKSIAALQADYEKRYGWWLAMSPYQRWYFVHKARYYTMSVKNQTVRGFLIGAALVGTGLFAWWQDVHPLVSAVLIGTGFILAVVLIWESERPHK